MFYILEPQHNASKKPDESFMVICPIAEAESFAVFTRETHDPNEDAEYLGDIAVADVLTLINKAV